MWREKTAFWGYSRWVVRLALVGLLMVVVWLYATAVRFGLIWDDPEWFGRVAGRPVLSLLRPSPDFQFYRPGTMLYNRLFWGVDGPLAVYALHWLQIGWHLVGITAVFTLSRLFGFSPWSAYAVAGLFAVYPFSHQAVSWAAPQQPMAAALQTLAWGLFLWSQRSVTHGQRGQGKYIASLVLFTLALTVQESTVPLAVLPLMLAVLARGVRPVLLPLVSRQQRADSPGWQRPFLYLIITLMYMILWTLAPRETGITRLAWESEVAAYLAQGFVYPALWGLGLVQSSVAWSTNAWLAAMGLIVAGLWGLGVVRGRSKWATAGLLWALLGILPSLVGLPYSYLSLSPRSLYYAAPGVAWLWVSAFWPSARRAAWWQTAVGLAVLAFIFLGSVRQVRAFQALYAPGTAHLQAAVQVMAAEDGELLFINFPDRYAPKTPPYPFGYWGVTLAPVVVELAEFAALQEGSTASSATWAMPWIDEEARANGPFQIDMRGVIIAPDELYRLAETSEAIWLTNYGADGRFSLHNAGHLQTGQATGECPLARFGESICLHAVQSQFAEDGLRVTFTWSVLDEVNPQATVFLHAGMAGQPPVAQADGDLWREMLPLRFVRSGDLIVDERLLPLSSGNAPVPLRVGVYDRVSGERLPAMDGAQRPLPDNAYHWNAD
jgi:hypothetical protein